MGAGLWRRTSGRPGNLLSVSRPRARPTWRSRAATVLLCPQGGTLGRSVSLNLLGRFSSFPSRQTERGVCRVPCSTSRARAVPAVSEACAEWGRAPGPGRPGRGLGGGGLSRDSCVFPDGTFSFVFQRDPGPRLPSPPGRPDRAAGSEPPPVRPGVLAPAPHPSALPRDEGAGRPVPAQGCARPPHACNGQCVEGGTQEPARR